MDLLKNSDNTLKQTQKTHYFTEILIWFTKILTIATIGMMSFGFIQIIIDLWF